MGLTDAMTRAYDESGFVVVPGVVGEETARQMIEHYMALRRQGPKPGDSGGTQDDPNDPNHQFPRMINMHGWDEDTRLWALNPALLDIVGGLLRDVPVLLQTMLYFKPPRARGQALHQDQQYITTDPLIGVWMALDRADQAVGGMVLVPGSAKYGLLRVEAADTSRSFTEVQAALPSDVEPVGVDLDPGDVLCFSGKTVHGSYPNETSDRWRRSFICHYTGRRSTKFEPAPGTHVSHLKR